MRSGLKEQFRETEHGQAVFFKQIVAATRIRHFSTATGDAQRVLSVQQFLYAISPLYGWENEAEIWNLFQLTLNL